MPSDIFVEALAGKCDPHVVNNAGLTLCIQFTPSDVFLFGSSIVLASPWQIGN